MTKADDSTRGIDCSLLYKEGECKLHEERIRKQEWQRYVGRKGGRRDFQIDLAIAIIDYGIQQDWKNKEETAKPSWMRQTKVKPCECKKCFFCRNNETTGIFHDKSSIIMTSPQSGKKRKKNIKYTSERVPLPSFSVYGSYCRQCYDNQSKTLTPSQKRRKCKMLHAKNRFASNVGVKDTIISTIIHNLVFICRHILLSTLAFRKNSNDKLRFKYDS